MPARSRHRPPHRARRKSSLALVRDQYNAGAVSYVALVTAEPGGTGNRISLIQAEAQRYADTARAVSGAGGGWWNQKAEDQDRKRKSTLSGIRGDRR